MKQTVLAIHGGHHYESHDAYLEYWKTREIHFDRMVPSDNWKNHLQEELGDDYTVLLPSMPSSDNAQYDEWKLWYERILSELDCSLILVGHSLGAMFLSKYYSEHEPAHSVHGLFLVSGRYDGPDDDLYPDTSFTIKAPLDVLTKRAEHVVFFHSSDDPVVPYQSFEQYQKLVPDATFHSFTDRHHFIGPSFPEIVAEIQSLDA